jgi:C_GCAxxG_C_C family probable redox protein
MTKAEMAVKQFSTGSACSQSVAMAFAEDAGLEPALAHKLTTGFGGGLGNRQYTCGVVTGAVFILSAIYGSSSPDQSDRKADTKRRAADFIKAFEKRKGSSSCRELLGVSMDEAREQNLFSTVCSDCVRVAAEELEIILKD